MSEKSKLNTIKGKKYFSDVFQTGKRVSTELINGIYLFDKSEEINFKYAVAVSKKISKKAVIRNRLKRLLRESIRSYFVEHEFIAQLEAVIFIWRKPVKTKYDFEFKIVKENIFRLLKDIESKNLRNK